MTENILVVGATGRVGRRLMQILQQDPNNNVFGSSSVKRDADNMIELDLHASFEDIRQTIRPFNKIFFTAGSRGKDLFQTDLMGNVKLIDAADQVGVQRFVQLTGMGSLDPDSWRDPHFASLQDYNVARHFADKALLQSNLPYTLVQAASLTEAAPTGKVDLMPVAKNGQKILSDFETPNENTLDDVATVLAEVANFPRTTNHIIAMKNGATPIQEALAAF
ncbi:uncharacterized protein YbjT (DUF2867 family) [Weissella uvarum]|uniref:NAD(P)H-binding protein n=1 Tax=Weissella uvarum TaxID=1479233 RepID=UPI00196078B2|nr:NAD(P)H-binding protein [Weissella uvarum]MBM7617505.1 uncharacterized protein YbjT (DUF2867 family) [Weissella uvarum]MCM0595611.1 NAD(P)H-binding protein [Weissella uvarum]